MGLRFSCNRNLIFTNMASPRSSFHLRTRHIPIIPHDSQRPLTPKRRKWVNIAHVNNNTYKIWTLFNDYCTCNRFIYSERSTGIFLKILGTMWYQNRGHWWEIRANASWSKLKVCLQIFRILIKITLKFALKFWFILSAFSVKNVVSVFLNLFNCLRYKLHG